MVPSNPELRIFIMRFLDDLQKNTGVSQKEVSEFIGIDQSNLSRIHRGKYTPTFKVFVAVASAYIALSKTMRNAFSIILAADKVDKRFHYEFNVGNHMFL